MNRLEQRIQQLEKQLAEISKSDRFTLSKTIQIGDGRSIQLGTTTGTRIGTAATQKLGFYGATPIVEPTASIGSAATNIYSTSFFADGTYSNNEMNMLNNIWNALIGLGLIKEIA